MVSKPSKASTFPDPTSKFSGQDAFLCGAHESSTVAFGCAPGSLRERKGPVIDDGLLGVSIAVEGLGVLQTSGLFVFLSSD